ncbi:unnamed protein product, partial [Prorocentrum cordatum]
MPSARRYVREEYGVEMPKHLVLRRLRVGFWRVVVGRLPSDTEQSPLAVPADDIHVLTQTRHTHATMNCEALCVARIQDLARQPMHAPEADKHGSVHRRQSEEVRGLADRAEAATPLISPASGTPLLHEPPHARIVRPEELAAVVELEGPVRNRRVVWEHHAAAIDRSVGRPAPQATPSLIEEVHPPSSSRQGRRSNSATDATTDDCQREGLVSAGVFSHGACSPQGHARSSGQLHSSQGL